MNRKQRRATTRKTTRVAHPAYYLMYSPHAKLYLASVDPDNQKLNFSEEVLALPIFTEEGARELAQEVWKVTGLQLAIQPRYQSHTH